MTPTQTDQRPQECRYHRKYARKFSYNLCAKCKLPMRLCNFYDNPINCPDFAPKNEKDGK